MSEQALADMIAGIEPINEDAAQAAERHLNSLTKPPGILIHGESSLPPASSTSTEWRPDALRRSARMQPAEPAPTMM